MQEGRGKTISGPPSGLSLRVEDQKFFPRPSRTLPTPFPFPLNRPEEEEARRYVSAGFLQL